MGYENFLADYTEVDPNEKITLSSTKTAWDNITDGADAYVYRDKGVNFFSGAYKFLMEIEYSISSTAQMAFYALTNILNDLKYIDDVGDYYECLYFGFTGALILARVNAGAKVTDMWTGSAYGTTYYVTIERTVGGILTAEIRTGSHEGALQDTLEVSDATTAYRYIHAFNHLRSISGSYADGFTQNLNLGLGEIVELDGTIPAQSSLTGALKTNKKIAGTIPAQSSLTGALKTNKKIAGTIPAQSSLISTLRTAKKIAGTISAQSSLTGALKISTKKRIAGNISAQSSLTGTLSIVGELIRPPKKRAKYESHIAA